MTSGVTVCVGRMARGGQGARALLGETFAGILGPERDRASHGDPVRWRQRCWAPLRRAGTALCDRGGAAAALGAALLAQARQRLTGWHRVREGTLPRSTLRSSMSPLRRAVERLWAAGRRSGLPTTAGTCQDIVPRREAFWTFGQVAGGEPTTKAAARASRPGVRWRQGSLGTQSAAGSRLVASLLTVVTTLQQPQRNGWEYLPTAWDAALRGDTAPSLLPVRDQQSQAVA